MGLHDAADDRQAQPGAALAVRARGACRTAAPAGVEDPRQILRRDAAAAVLDREHHPARLVPGADRDRAVGRCRTDRVDQQIAQYAGDLLGVHPHRQRYHPAVHQPHPAHPRQRPGSRERVVHQVVHRHPRQRQGQRPGLDTGQFEEVVDHRGQPVHLDPHPCVVARGVLGDAVLQRLGHRPQPGERGAQIVRDPGDQFAPGGIQRPLPLPCRGEPPAGLLQRPGQCGQFGGGRLGGRHEAALAADRTGRARQLPAARRDPPPEEQRGRQRHHPGYGHHGHHHAQVVPGQEHRLGDRHRPRRHRGHRQRRHREQRQGDRAPPQGPYRGRGEQSRQRRAERRQRHDDQEVRHGRSSPPGSGPGSGCSSSPRGSKR